MDMSRESREAVAVIYEVKDGMRKMFCRNCGWDTWQDAYLTLANYCPGCGLRAAYQDADGNEVEDE